MSDNEKPSMLKPVLWDKDSGAIFPIDKLDWRTGGSMSKLAFAKLMFWLLNIGFLVIAVDHWTVQLPEIAAIGALIMAVPIVWICWKEGL